MKKVFWTTIFWFAVAAGFIAYMKWFDQPLATQITNFIVKDMPLVEVAVDDTTVELENLSGKTSTGIVDTAIISTENKKTDINSQLAEIQSKLDEINEKIDIQNSSTPDAVSVSLKTTKKTNVWIYPLDGTEYKKYTLNPSDDILKDSLDILFEKSPFALVDTKLDNDGNLTINIKRVPDTAFGGSAAVEAVRKAIEKTALQFSQIKKVTITPEEVLQP